MKYLNEIKEYFVTERLYILITLLVACVFMVSGNFSAAVLCLILLELKDVNEALRGEK